MPIPLPNLDDRRWADLLEEGRALIPVYAPEWTDHNVHDPGVTLIELFAWLAETNAFRLNRIPDRHKLKFLSLLDFRPLPPRPARALLRLELPENATPLSLPATLEFATGAVAGQTVKFRTVAPITVAPNRLQAIQVRHADGFENLTGRWQRGESFLVFGDLPQAGMELYLGFNQPLPVNVPVSLFFRFAGTRSGEEERRRLILETQSPAGSPPVLDDQQMDLGREEVPPHHEVRTVWEFLTDEETWSRLNPDNGEVDDDTRAFTLDGRVMVSLPAAMAAARLGQVEAELFYLRCRYESGDYDAPPIVQNLLMNGVVVEQAAPVGIVQWPIAIGAIITGAQPATGERAQFNLSFNGQGQIAALDFVENVPGVPIFLVLSFNPGGATQAGILSVEAALLGFGSGRPHQVLSLPQAPVLTADFKLFTLEQNEWRTWRLCSDFDASARSDPDFVLEPNSGTLTFSDGEKGRVLPRDAMVIAQYRATRAEGSNVAAGAIRRLADSPHNRALLPDFDGVTTQLIAIENPVAAAGGMAGETLADATGRAITLMNTPRRAVTLSDYETLAKETPGTQIARVMARTNFDPDFPNKTTPGTNTIIIMPNMPAPRPAPSPGLRQAVAAHLYRRRVIGTRVKVAGPTYKGLIVRATVRARAGMNRSEVRQSVIAALHDFFHPLTGGPERIGWPFGRDVFRSEVLQTIDEVPGVNYVLLLELISDSGQPTNGNVSLGPLELVDSGQHQIEVV